MINCFQHSVSILGAIAGGILTGGIWYAVGLPEQYILDCPGFTHCGLLLFCNPGQQISWVDDNIRGRKLTAYPSSGIWYQFPAWRKPCR